MTSNTYIQIDKKRDEIEAAKKATEELNKGPGESMDSVEQWLKLKDECEERYRRLGEWIVDQTNDLPF